MKPDVEGFGWIPKRFPNLSLIDSKEFPTVFPSQPLYNLIEWWYRNPKILSHHALWIESQTVQRLGIWGDSPLCHDIKMKSMVESRLLRAKHLEWYDGQCISMASKWVADVQTDWLGPPFPQSQNYMGKKCYLHIFPNMCFLLMFLILF